MLTSRRRFLFGVAAVAAPAIVGIDGVMKFFTPAPEPLWLGDPQLWLDLKAALGKGRAATMVPERLIVSPANEHAAHVMLDARRFREMMEPGFYRLFEEAYGGSNRLRALAERRAHLLNRIFDNPNREKLHDPLAITRRQA